MKSTLAYIKRTDLREGRACHDALEWISNLPAGTTPAEAWARCPRGDWLLWLARRAEVPAERLRAAVLPSVMRALRVYAPAALDAAADGYCELSEHAKWLRILPDDCDLLAAAENARAAGVVAWDVAREAASAEAWETAWFDGDGDDEPALLRDAKAEKAAETAAERLDFDAATSAVNSAMTAASAACWQRAAHAATMAACAAADSRRAVKGLKEEEAAAKEEEEHARCAHEVRAALGAPTWVGGVPTWAGGGER